MVAGIFDGNQKLFICNSGVTQINIAELYSDWKQWVLSGEGIGYLPAFEAIGGQPLPNGLFVGQTYFLINGWKIKPQLANHRLSLDGNLYTNDGSNITIPIAGYTIEVSLNTSAQTQAISTTGSTLSLSDIESSLILAKQTAITELKTLIDEIYLLHGLKLNTPLLVTETTRIAGNISQSIATTENQTTVTRQ